MDQSKVIEFVQIHLAPMQQFLSVQDWKVGLEFKHLGSGSFSSTRAQCDCDFDYLIATLRFDSTLFGRDDEILDALFHELCHLIIAPFDLFYECAHKATAEDAQGSLKRLYYHSMEKTVNTLEFCWRNAGWRDLYLDQFTRPS
jgi:hypothetical protein